MLYFLDATGNILRVVPERIYQGSSEGNKIMLVAPFANTVTTEVVFKLPDGQFTLPYTLHYIGQMQESTEKTMCKMHAWQCVLPITITQNYGEVEIQFYFTSTKNEKIASAVTSFIVERGLLPVLPDSPTEDVYQKIKESLATIQADLANAFYSARAIYAWNSSYSYNANEITFYPCGKYGAFIQSLQSENTNIPIVDGIVDNAWKVLISFDVIADRYFDEIKSIAIEARQELQQVQNILENLKTVNNSILVYVDILPERGEENKIYAILSKNNNQLFSLYIWVDKWICLGEKGIETLTQVPEGAVLYLPQSLTLEQQLQARKNIGAQSAGNYLIEEQLQQHLQEYATTATVDSYFAQQTEQLENTFDSKMLALKNELDGQISLQQQDIAIAVDKKLLEINREVQEKIDNLTEEIQKLQNNTDEADTSTPTITGSSGTDTHPIYLENGEFKPCTNIRANGDGLHFIIDSNCPTDCKNRNIFIGSKLSALGVERDSTILGSGLLCSGEKLVAIGTGQVNGDNLLSIGIENSVNGSFSVALGPLAVVEGEMSCAIGPGAVITEDYATVIGSDENQNIYYYGSLQSKSDMRDKADIEELDNKKSLEFITALRTITYVNNDRRKYRDKSVKIKDSSIGAYDKIAHAKGEKKGNRRQIGVLAQDVELNMQKVYQKEIGNLVNDSLFKDRLLGKNNHLESQKFVNYIAFIPLLISAMQEQQKQINRLRKCLQDIKKESK